MELHNRESPISSDTFSHTSFHKLYEWSDTNQLDDLNTSRSTSRFIFQIGSSTFSPRKAIVLLFLIKPKYVVATTATIELIWLQVIITKLGYTFLLLSIIYCDNQSCIMLSKNLKHHDRSKHINLQFHFLCDKVKPKTLKLEFTSRANMWVDILIKSHSIIQHHDCLKEINVVPSLNLQHRSMSQSAFLFEA